MAILLDTQILIWLEESPDNISDKARHKAFNEPATYFSLASVWEMAIKIKTGKLKIKTSLEALVKNFRMDYKYILLSIELPHIYQTQQLPLHHRDPFDRLLIAQSIVENINIVSSDEAFDAYGIKRIW